MPNYLWGFVKKGMNAGDIDKISKLVYFNETPKNGTEFVDNVAKIALWY